MVQIGNDATRQGAHTRLDKHMGGPLLELFQGLPQKGGVAQHNVPGDFGVPRQGRVLHQQGAMLLGIAGGKAHRVVIVVFRHLDCCPKGLNGRHTGGAAPLGHQDQAGAPQTLGHPGQGLAVVAVGAGDHPRLWEGALLQNPVHGIADP